MRAAHGARQRAERDAVACHAATPRAHAAIAAIYAITLILRLFPRRLMPDAAWRGRGYTGSKGKARQRGTAARRGAAKSV